MQRQIWFQLQILDLGLWEAQVLDIKVAIQSLVNSEQAANIEQRAHSYTLKETFSLQTPVVNNYKLPHATF